MAAVCSHLFKRSIQNPAKNVSKTSKNLDFGGLGAPFGGSWGALGELLGPVLPQEAPRTVKIAKIVASRLPSWGPIWGMLAPSSRKKSSEHGFLRGPVQDHFFSDFGVLFWGVQDSKNEVLASTRIKFSLFHEVRFFFDLGLHFGRSRAPFWNFWEVSIHMLDVLGTGWTYMHNLLLSSVAAWDSQG